MALKNGKHASDKKSTAKPEHSNGVGQTEMGNHDSKGTIKFSSWNQTNTDVTITLHTGRNLTSNEISVDFTDLDVKVGLTDGRRWYCRFNQPIEKDTSRAVLKKMKLALIAKKKVPNVNWPTYEKTDDSSSVSDSESSAGLKSCFDIKSMLKSKSTVSDSEIIKPHIMNPGAETLTKHGLKSKTGDVKTSGVLSSDVREGKVTGRTGSRGDTESPQATEIINDPKLLPPLSEQSAVLVAESDVAVCNSGNTVPISVVGAIPSEANAASRDFHDSDVTSELCESMDYEDMDTPVSTTPLSYEVSSSLRSTGSLGPDNEGNVEYAGQNDHSLPGVVKMEPSSEWNADVGAAKMTPDRMQVSDVTAALDVSDIAIKMEVSDAPAKLELSELSAKMDVSDLAAKMETSDLAAKMEASGMSLKMETDAASESDIQDIEHVKHDFYERGDLIVLTIYVKQIRGDSVKVKFGDSELEIIFQTSEPRFIQLYEGSTTETFFRWKIDLLSTILTEKCSYQLFTMKLNVNLVKKEQKKWGKLVALPQMAGSSFAPAAQNTWMPTCHSDSSSSSGSSSTERKKPAVAVVGEPNNLPPGGGSAADNWKDTSSGVNKPTCKVFPLTSSSDDSGFSPSYSKWSTAVENPGMMGLDNIGNTCFMNSVLQVLANTIELKQYFLDGCYQKELNYDNPLGMGGKLALAFGYLMKVLWTSNQSSFEPSKLKNLVASKQTRFVGYSQHDAEEFMEFLLDGLHEDLNRVKKKPYFEEKEISGESDEVIADEAWRRHKTRNDSHVIDVFQGQYRSRVVCPICETVSITFDPFSIIQVPIPKEKKLVNVVFMSPVSSNRPIKYPIQIGVDANVDNLKDALYQRTRVRPENIRVLKVSKSQISAEFTTGMSLQEVTSRDELVACAVLSKTDVGEPVREFTVVQRTVLPRTIPRYCNYCHRENGTAVQLKRCTKCYMASYCDPECQKKDWAKHKLLCLLQGEPVGCPFIISVPESQLTFSYLCRAIEAYARYSVNAFQPPPLARKNLSSRKSSTASSLSFSSVSSSASASEQSGDDVDAADASSGVNSCSSFCEAEDRADSDQESTRQIHDRDEERMDEILSGADSKDSQPPVRRVIATQQNTGPTPPPPFFLRPCTRNGTALQGFPRLEEKDPAEGETLSLDGCRSLLVEWKNKDECIPYVEVETKDLEYEECEIKFQNGNGFNVGCGTDITLGDCLNLFTEPEVLHPDQTWFCPKCQVHRQAMKEMSLWRLPPTLIIHLKRFSFSSMFWRNKIDDKVTFPLSGLDMSPYLKKPLTPDEPAPIYDLYGVINHKGDLVGGHYTAFSRCPDPDDFRKSQVDWRFFDDSNVRTCGPANVTTNSAYVLFYRRRDAGRMLKERSQMGIPSLMDVFENGVNAVVTDRESSPDVDLESVRVESEEDDIADKPENIVKIMESVTCSSIGDQDINTVD